MVTQEVIETNGKALVVPKNMPDLNDLDVAYSLTDKYMDKNGWEEFKDKELRCILIGFEKLEGGLNKEGFIAAKFVYEKGIFYAAQSVLISAVQTLKDEIKDTGVALSIIYHGVRGGGKAMIFEVKRLTKKS